MEPTNHVREAVAAAGGQAKLAALLGVTQQAVSSWVRRGWVPVRRAAEIEHLLGVSRQRLVDPRLVDILDPGTGL